MNKFVRWSSLLLLPSLFFSVSSLAAALDVNINEAKMINLSQDAKSIFISNTHIADYQPMTDTKIMVFGKEAGTATITILNAQERVIYSNKIRVVHDTKELDALIKEQFPQASVHSESLGGKLWLKGSVPTPVMAHSIVSVAKSYLSPTVAPQQEKSSNSTTSTSSSSKNSSNESDKEDELVNQLVVTMPTQVNIRVRIAEVSRNVSNKLGIKWGSVGQGVGSFLYTKPWDVSSWGKPTLSALVDALASDGTMSILAEPNLTAMSGEDASFLVGGEIPIPLIQGDTATVEYKPFGVNLNFTPVVLGPDRISLKVSPEVSSVTVENQTSLNGNVYPSFTSRRASTTIELASGQSFALGGLLQSHEIDQIQKLPGVSNIPVLGGLFRSTEYQRRETELIIIATAYLVEPVRNDSLPLPTDNIVPLSDLERLLAIPRPKGRKVKDSNTYTDNRKPRLLGDNGFYY
ncbi:type II and III secretion system protein family protein [Vibrio tubiashii]|uniref:Flp pilus assembly protein CpaC n=1 Tax=Vibrio tubiashii ATCC 19109 TaxID=1051646 RepID=F9T7V0_9VIBR|nr:type II and III secretion system protein family protein [Vibrio tubiashii]AIW16801.1 secretin [Vibrio tubiashii ATCC 19109]EGU53483.1 Flp pilus assembly protein CpaC [Vibrio tubiashii ATCC 19109]EIF02147.1 Flp pilus assembly protein CpaC [Vibrio tubiashii NCIMB 1337 = ATCC 19106]